MIIEKYKQKILEVRLFEKSNAKVFREHDALTRDLNALAENLRAECKEKGDIESEDKLIKATRVERWKKYYDFKLFMKAAKTNEYDELNDVGGIETTINKEIFNDLAEQEKISKKTLQKCFQEKLFSTSVIIKSKI